MSSSHHTPIATGAAANASVVNSPLGQLDQAIIDLNTEADNIGTDNLLFDPANRTATPNVDWGGRTRWYNATALSIVDPDASNPYGSRTLRFDNTQSAAGKRLWCDEVMAASGDYLNFASVCKAAGGSFRLNIQWLDSGGAVLSTSTGSTVAMSGSSQTLTLTGATRPANCMSFRCNWERVSGTDSLDVYNGWVTKGNRFAFVAHPPVADSYLYPLQGSATWDPPNLSAGAEQTTTVTVTGAVLGDWVIGVSFSLDLAGTTLTGYVSAANTVTVVHRNGTGAPVNLGSGTLRALVQPRY